MSANLKNLLLESITCQICQHIFDSSLKKPVCIDCGHTVCLDCAKQLENELVLTCPFDRRTFQTSPDKLGVNYSILGLVNHFRENLKEKTQREQQHQSSQKTVFRKTPLLPYRESPVVSEAKERTNNSGGYLDTLRNFHDRKQNEQLNNLKNRENSKQDRNSKSAKKNSSHIVYWLINNEFVI